MSYEIVRGIRFTSDKVYIRAASNNVFPRNYDEEEWPRFSEMLRIHGKEAVDKEILILYFEGWLRGDNKYERAVHRYLVKNNIDRDSKSHIYSEYRENHLKKDELKDAIYEMLCHPPKKNPCALINGRGLFLLRVGSRSVYSHPSRKKIFHNSLDAEYLLKHLGLDEMGYRIVPI